MTLRHVSGAHNTARCYGTGKKTGARVCPHDADCMQVPPAFRKGCPRFIVCFFELRKRNEIQTEREGIPALWMYYTAVAGGYVFPTRIESETELEDGFYFEVFPPIVHYCRELLLREAEVSKIGVQGFCRARKYRQVQER